MYANTPTALPTTIEYSHHIQATITAPSVKLSIPSQSNGREPKPHENDAPMRPKPKLCPIQNALAGEPLKIKWSSTAIVNGAAGQSQGINVAAPRNAPRPVEPTSIPATCARTKISLIAPHGTT